METIIVKQKETPTLINRILMRETPLDKWLTTPELNDRLSGTLKKNARIGFKYREQLKHEAIAQTLGWGFEAIPTTYVTFNDAMTEGDCHSLTEVGWHVDRLLYLNPFIEDEYELQYIIVQDVHGNIERQGVGLILKQTSISWIPKGNIVFALLTEYDSVKKTWTECVNPF